MSEFQPGAVARPVGVIEADLPCRKCGYNLRGLDAEGRCPECGTAVGYSVRGDLLRYSDPDWLAKLRRGMTLILLAVLVLVAMVILNVLLVSSRAIGPAAVTFAPFAGLAAQGLWYVGIWLLTESDPSGLGEDDYGAIRRFIRIAMLVNVASAALSLVLQFATIPAALASALVLIAGAASLTGLAGFCCQLIYLSRLARRLPDDRLARRAKSLAWTIGVAYGLVLVAGLVMIPVRPGVAAGGPNPLFVALGAASALAGLVLLVAGILYLLMLERFGKRLKAEERVARQTWAAGPSPAA